MKLLIPIGRVGTKVRAFVFLIRACHAFCKEQCFTYIRADSEEPKYKSSCNMKGISKELNIQLACLAVTVVKTDILDPRM